MTDKDIVATPGQQTPRQYQTELFLEARKRNVSRKTVDLFLACAYAHRFHGANSRLPEMC